MAIWCLLVNGARALTRSWRSTTRRPPIEVSTTRAERLARAIPAGARPLRERGRCARAGRPLAAASAPNRQPFPAIEPVELLGVYRDPRARQQGAEPAVTEASALVGQSAQRLADLRRIRRRHTPHRLPVDVDQPAGVALGEAARAGFD